MSLKALLVSQPGPLVRSGLLVLSVLITLLVGYLHILTDPAYELHVFFILPMLVVSWFIGKRFEFGVAVPAAVERFIADRSLASDQANILHLIFNTAMRLAIFLYGALLIGEMRRIFQRWARMACEDGVDLLLGVIAVPEPMQSAHQAYVTGTQAPSRVPSLGR